MDVSNPKVAKPKPDTNLRSTPPIGCREWVALAAFYYPILWICSSIAAAGPALMRWAFFGNHIRIMFVNLGGFSAISWRAGSSIAPRFSAAPWILLAIVLPIEAILWIIGRRKLFAGLAMAALADAALNQVWLGLRFASARNQAFAHSLPATIPLFIALWLGLRQMALSGGDGYVRGAARAAAGFLPMPILGFFLVGWRSPWFGWKMGAAALLPAFIAGILAPISFGLSSPRRRSAPDNVRAPARFWLTFALGAIVTIVLYMSARAAPLFLEKERVSQARAVLNQLPAPAADEKYPKIFFQRGVNFTAEFPATYDSKQARRMLAQLPKYGINAIALVPYGWTRNGADRVERGRGMGAWENDLGLEILTRVAHQRGMTVMLKPAVWHAFDLRFPDPAARERWFASYTRFIVHYAALATAIHADIFSIGGEFVHLTQYSDDWLKLIAAVRQVYHGPIVYAANFGTEFERITFWDSLDYIGLQEYYPLPANLSAANVVKTVEGVEKKYHEPVIFTEVGFPSLAGANIAPWDNSGVRPIEPGLQAKCYRAIFKAFYGKSWFEGMYWWNFPSNGRGGPDDGSFSMLNKPAMTVLAHWYLSGRR